MQWCLSVGYGRFHWLVLFLCGWAVSSDAIEVLSVSFMLPSAQKDLDMSSEDKGWLNAIIFVGKSLKVMKSSQWSQNFMISCSSHLNLFFPLFGMILGSYFIFVCFCFFSSSGMMLGGYFWGSLADRHGRRTVLLGSLTVNGLGGLVSSTSQVFWLFLLARFISGIG